MLWQDKNVLVLGYGITGKSMVSYLRNRGAVVYIYDDDLGFSEPGSTYWQNKDKVFEIGNIDIIAVSPGFSPTHSVISFFKSRNIDVIGDVEIAYIDRGRDDWVAITGTNGKTTTTMLIDFLLRNIGISSQTFGNIGVPVLDAVEFKGIPVAEISSFQLDYIKTFKPHVGVFLNLTDDHLNRHRNMQIYFETKLKMFTNQTQTDFAVLNKDNVWTQKARLRINAHIVWFSLTEPADVFVDSKYKIILDGKTLWNISHISRFQYPPYLEDLLAAISAVYALGYGEDLYNLDVNILSNFVFARHRMEEVANIGGIIFINDSKATNVASTIAAISGFDGKRLLLILGGSKKDTSYDELAREIARINVKRVALIGETANDIAKALEDHGYINYIKARSLEEAVFTLYQSAESGDVILLSPACASFDMFRNYKHRGNTFIEIVNKLQREYERT